MVERMVWLLLLLLVGADGAPSNHTDTVRTPSLQPAIERGLINLSLGLQRASAASTARDENIIFAPLSIAAVNALLLAASAGVTKRELETLFGVEGVSYNQDDLHKLLSDFIFSVETNKQLEQNLVAANGLFPDLHNQVSPEYIKFAKRFYQCEVISLDYRTHPSESTEFINSWVSNRTEGKISQILEDVAEPLTSLIIANAFYFKGSWEQPFMERFTKMQNFTINKNEVVKVPLMVGILEVPYYHRKGSHRVIGLPYKGGDLFMYFVLPENNLTTFVENLTYDSVKEFMNQTTRQRVIAAIPKMRVEASLELSKALYSLGLRSLFYNANLEHLGRGSFVSEVVHKVAVELTEKGTEAAASTSVIIHRDGSMPLFRADRPFLFFISHQKTNAILFWGTVFRPVV
ncbi:serpin B8 [Halyomorpha halys]|uniref:serpin B8 n=1 Tax=Halyomorpha halys TaxID=286706 RepID=UPI0006D51ACD|nr:serpin B8-like [Halyomorpha halys]